jgi:hypothetical protein
VNAWIVSVLQPEVIGWSRVFLTPNWSIFQILLTTGSTEAHSTLLSSSATKIPLLFVN